MRILTVSLKSAITKTHSCNIKIFSVVKVIFYWKNVDIFNIFVQNIDKGYTLVPLRGCSNEYPHSMF